MSLSTVSSWVTNKSSHPEEILSKATVTGGCLRLVFLVHIQHLSFIFLPGLPFVLEYVTNILYLAGSLATWYWQAQGSLCTPLLCMSRTHFLHMFSLRLLPTSVVPPEMSHRLFAISSCSISLCSVCWHFSTGDYI